MFKMGVLFGLIGILLLAGRSMIPVPAPKDRETLDAYQIEMLNGSNEYTAVKNALDWTIGS